MTDSVVICSPTSDLKDYCLDRWGAMVRSWGYEVVMADNSLNHNHARTLRRQGLNTVVTKRHNMASKTLLESQQTLRQVVLGGPWQWMLILESDVFPKSNPVPDMLSLPADVVAQTYWHRWGDGDWWPCLQVQDSAAGDGGYGMLTEFPIQQVGQVGPMSEFRGQGWQIINAGLGCCLIHRKVLERVDFRRQGNNPHTYADGYFYKDVGAAGFRVYLDLQKIHEHDTRRDWRAEA